MSLERETHSAIIDIQAKQRRRVAIASAVGAFSLFPATGAYVGYLVMEDFEHDNNAVEAKESAAATRCANFVLSKTLDDGKRVVIKASELTKQQREDCNTPAPDNTISQPYGFEGNVIYTDYTLELPDITTLESIANEKKEDSKTENVLSLGVGIAVGSLGGFAAPLFSASGILAIQKNRKRNNGKFSYKDAGRRLRKSTTDTLMLLGR